MKVWIEKTFNADYKHLYGFDDMASILYVRNRL